jgi:ankyrin repeat protein
MWAAREGRFSTICFLRDRGATPALRDNEGRTALMLASREGHADSIRVLLSRRDGRAEINALDKVSV